MGRFRIVRDLGITTEDLVEIRAMDLLEYEASVRRQMMNQPPTSSGLEE